MTFLLLGQGRCGDQPQKTLNGWKQQRPIQGNYCWSNSTRMGAGDPGSLPLTPERDSRAFVHVPHNTLLAREDRGDTESGQVGEAQKDITEFTE